MSKILMLNYENDHDYNLIGIHTSLDDFRLAYFLNKALNIRLKRHIEDLDFGIDNTFFSLYSFNCKVTFNNWSLISNKYNFVSNTTIKNPLFKEQYQTSILIQEKKQVDYFLKIESDMSIELFQKAISKINNIKNVITSYSINPQTLKSKDFLIF